MGKVTCHAITKLLRLLLTTTVYIVIKEFSFLQEKLLCCQQGIFHHCSQKLDSQTRTVLSLITFCYRQLKLNISYLMVLHKIRADIFRVV